MLDILVVCEARADAATVQGLIDRVVMDEVPWVTADWLDNLRQWVGDPGAPVDGWRYLKWSTVKHWGPERRRRMHGKYGGAHKGEFQQARKALLWTAACLPETRAIILVRDDDRKGLREDYERARKLATSNRAIAIAIPIPEREAWHLIGFDPLDEREQNALDAISDEIGCHPCRQAHTLNPKQDHAPRGTKRVLKHLTGGDAAREAACLNAHDLTTLAERGDKVGLASFLREVAERIAPLIGG